MIIPATPGRDYSFLVSVGSLLTVFGFLTSRATTVGASDILFLLGLGLHLATLLRLVTTTSEVDAVLEDTLEIVHFLLMFTVYSLRFTDDYICGSTVSSHFNCKL